MKISPARKSAFEILLKIEKERAFSSILLPIYEEQLEIKDRSLCHEITLGVLRNKIYLDFIIQKLTKKNLKKFDLEVLTSLRIGIYQILFLDKIPAYSAINESVNLVKFAKKTSASGLVNAVLRKIAKGNIKFSFENDIEKLSVETSHPQWIIKNWIDQFGFEDTQKFADSNNQIPKIDFRFTPKFLKLNNDRRNQISENLNDKVSRSDYVKNCFNVEKFDADLRELAGDGLIYFQDEASQMVANCLDLKDGEMFFDVCASPGSKTSLIAANLIRDEQKASVIAGDIYNQRVQLLKNNCQKQSADAVNILQYDAENSLPFGEKSFDKILIDAPCSGTGTIRHNPEIRYFLKQDDFAELQIKQLKILNNASKLLKADGKLIYSTCSLEKTENEEVVNRFLAKHDHFCKVTPNIHKKFLTEEKFGRTFSYKDNMDSFFIALLQRK